MPSLKLADNAFGTLGLTITESLDLAALSAGLGELLGVNYQLDGLDLSAVTRTGLTATGVAVAGAALPDSVLTVGGFGNFDQQQTAVSNFRQLRLTEATAQAEGSEDGIIYLDMDIQPGLLRSYGSENVLTFDDQLQVLDFSGIGEGNVALTVSLNALAAFDDPQAAFSGYRIIGSANADEVYGFNHFGDFPVGEYTGSNSYLLGAGNDRFLGGEDIARVDGGDGDDIIQLNIELAPAGNEVFGGAGNDLILGGPQSDLLDGGDGDDVISGYAGDNLILGGAGNDLLFSGFGTSRLEGGAGNDTLYAGEGTTTLVGGQGNDRFVVAEMADLWARMDVADSTLSQAFVWEFTGQAAAGTTVIEDFDAAEDLILFGVSEFSISSPMAEFLLEGYQDGGNFFEFFEFFGEGSFGYTVEDVQGTISWNNAILQVDQSAEFTESVQYLDIWAFVDSSQELSVDAAFEIRYHQASESSWAQFDIFSGLSVARQGEAGPVNGQDKINLSLLGLSDRDLEGNASGEVSALLFRTLDLQTQDGFSLSQLSESNPELTDFFLDPLADVYRPVHVEYMAGSQNEGFDSAVVYVDADGDGSFHIANDMVFVLEDIRAPRFAEDLVASDLYDASNGSGIFIFDSTQESFWFNDPVSEWVIGD